MDQAVSIQLGHFLNMEGGVSLDTPGVTNFAYPEFPRVVWIAAAIRVPLGDNPAYRPQLTAEVVDPQGRAMLPGSVRAWQPRSGWDEGETSLLIYGVVAASLQAPGDYVVVTRINDQEAGRIPIQVTRCA